MTKRHTIKQNYSIKATVFGGDIVEFRVPEVYTSVEEIACFILSVVPNWNTLRITKRTMIMDTKCATNASKPVHTKISHLQLALPGSDITMSTKVNNTFANKHGIIPNNIIDFFGRNGR